MVDYDKRTGQHRNTTNAPFLFLWDRTPGYRPRHKRGVSLAKPVQLSKSAR